VLRNDDRVAQELIEMSLDDVQSWPPQLLDLLASNEQLLRDYAQAEEILFDDSAWGPDYVPMALRHNPFSDQRQAFVSALRAEYRGQIALRGFHCTRLTDDEVAKIRSEGMMPPDASMLRERIIAVQNANGMMSQIADRLIETNDASDLNRTGRIWFIFTAELLKRQSGVEWLFRYWGGEALYGRHISDPETGPVLASIGQPTIVEATVPLAADLIGFPDKQIINQFLASRGLPTSERDYSDRTTLPVPPSRVRRIISRADDEFELLTRCAAWKPPLS
jgi:hypothetical protein